MPQFYIDSTDFSTATAIYSDALCTVPAQDGYYASCGVVRQQLNGTLLPYTECIDCKGYEKPVEGELLLDLYPDSAAAYSLRQLNTSYTGSAVRVRRASDSTEQDIGFDANGDLDTSALTTFCAGTDGFVVTWYDQSGNGFDAVQATTSAQPQIVASGSVLMENGKPAIGFYNSTNYLLTSATVVTGQEGYAFNVYNSGDGVFRISQANPSSITGSFSLDNTVATASPKYLRFLNLDGAGNNIAEGSTDIYNLQVLATYSSDSTNWAAWINSVSQTLNVTIGANNGSWFGDYQFPFGIQILNRLTPGISNAIVQEIVLYASDQSANRAGIESNINAYHNIYWDGSQPSLLDTYTGSAAAYSLRALNSDYLGPLVRVRRASDSAETDINALYDGSLNVSAIESFCSGTDGFVVTWYDQSGNSNDAVQATTADQPQIVSSGSVLTDNGKPSLNFNGSYSLETTYQPQLGTASAVHTHTYSVASQLTTHRGSIWRSQGTVDLLFQRFDSSKFQTLVRDSNSVITNVSSSVLSQSVQYLLHGEIDAGTVSNYVNGAIDGVGSPSFTGDLNLTSPFYIGSYLSSSDFLQGNISELIFYPSDQSANRAGIESNINTYYSIY